MKSIKEITVFAGGNINDINTWSGVPFFFCNALKSKEIKLNYVNVGIERKLEWIYNKLTGTIIIKLLRNRRADYSTSLLRYVIVRRKIKRGVLQYPNSDCLVFFSFCYSAAGITKIPSIMISDWTLDYFIKFNLQRKPLFFEKRALCRDDKQIEATSIVFSLFPGITAYLQSKYKNKNIYYLGNAVNSVREPTEAYQDIISNKHKSHKLLFIGGKKYLKGLEVLMGAFQLLKNEFSDITIHIVGFTEKDYPCHIIEKEGGGLQFYGYLDKNITSDNDTYYTLLQESTIYINTTPLWSSFQSPVEAMYFYTPIIISPNSEFLKIFGSDIEKCCIFCTENTPELLANHIKYILTNKNYRYMCEFSRHLTRDFTWNAVADNFLKITTDVFNSKGV